VSIRPGVRPAGCECRLGKDYWASQRQMLVAKTHAGVELKQPGTSWLAETHALLEQDLGDHFELLASHAVEALHVGRRVP
jgi:hypothetical protein